MVERFGPVIFVLLLSVIIQGVRDKAVSGDAAAPMAGAAIRPLEVVTGAVSRGLVGLRSPRVGFDTGEERRAEIRRAADDLFNVADMARRALGQHWKGAV